MTAAAIRAAAANFHGCLERLWPLAARRGVSRNVYRRLHRGADAGPAHHGSARRAAGIHQIVLGLSRSPGERCAHRAGPRVAAAAIARLSTRWSGPTASTATSSRRSGAWRPITAPRRRPSGDPLHRHARLHRPPAELFPRGIPLRAGNSPARRRQARPAGRLMGGRLRPDPVHADGIQALCGGFRSRRPPRRGQLGPRHHRLDRQQPEEGWLGHRADLGLRSGGAGELQFSARRPCADDADPRLGAQRARAPRRQAVPASGRPRIPADPGRRAGTRLPDAARISASS